MQGEWFTLSPGRHLGHCGESLTLGCGPGMPIFLWLRDGPINTTDTDPMGIEYPANVYIAEKPVYHYLSERLVFSSTLKKRMKTFVDGFNIDSHFQECTYIEELSYIVLFGFYQVGHALEKQLNYQFAFVSIAFKVIPQKYSPV